MTASIYQPQAQSLTITDKAIGFFRKKLSKHEQQAIRISVKKSGCTGYAYVIDYGEKATAGDTRQHFDDITVYISEKALPMIVGSEIDLQQQGLNQAIVFNNPNITAACGCGNSFSTDAADAE